MEDDYFCDACGYSQAEPGNCPHCKIVLKAPEDAGHDNGEDLDDILFQGNDLVDKTIATAIGEDESGNDY